MTTVIIELPPPMQCRTAQFIVNGTSWCRIHKPT